MTPYDELLLWASEKRTGSIESLRAACGWVAQQVPGRRRGQDLLDDLLALGHVDVRDRRWSVTPSTLGLLADAGGNAVMFGARPAWFAEAVRDLDLAKSPLLQDLSDHLVENLLVDQLGPATWFVAFGPQAPLTALSELGAGVLEAPAERALQQCLDTRPWEGDLRTVRPGELAGRLTFEEGISRGLSWEMASGDQLPGFYRYLQNNQRIYAQRSSDGWHLMDYRWAVWKAAPHHIAGAWFVPGKRRLYLPAAMRPPLPVERALLLRTGRLPQIGTAPQETGSSAQVAAYDNITHAFAIRVGQALGKEIKLV